MAQFLGLKILLIFTVILVIHLQAQSLSRYSIFRRPKTTVAIVSNFSNASEIVVVQCRSRKFALNAKAIRVNETYAFRFRPNFFRGLYFYYCKFTFETGVAVTQDVYDPWRDSYGKKRCKRYCLWVARDDALYGYRETGLQDITLAWPKPLHYLNNP